MTPAPIAAEAGWGEARMRDRRRRRVRRAAAIIVAATVSMIALPFLAGVADGFLGRPHRVSVPATEVMATTITFAIVVLGAGIWGWREADEVQRRDALSMWATIGVVGFIGHPLAEQLERALGSGSLADALWWVSLAAGLAVFAWRKARG
ncbi:MULTISPECIES: hypothetical protein [Sphingomonas]|uniref:hypothetical protein n=1 Tax=Sphingomonas TaxID=13687 RepID=UPI000A436DE0|nr:MULTISPECIES: hypothetical protein [Sphingomonas]MBY0300599.1 hypothetical protein [Sphingomonas ginsenosidimutans]